MVRVFAFLVGLAFAGVLAISLFSGVVGLSSEPARGAGVARSSTSIPSISRCASDGPFGKFDNQQLQRGFQVYGEVCAACHGLSLVSFRELEHIGYNEAEVKKIAADWKIQVPSINPDTGEAATRKALAVRHLPRRRSPTTSRRARRTTMRFRPTCR